MSEHRHNPVVKWLKENIGFARLSLSERNSMKRKAHEEAINSYFDKNPRKMGRLLDGGWIIRGMRKEYDFLMEKAKKTKAEVEQIRLKNAGLKVVSFHLRPELWKLFKVKLARDRVTVRAVTTAMVEFYVKGWLSVEKEKDKVDIK